MEDNAKNRIDLAGDMKIVRELDERRWREFVEKHSQGQIFHTPEMLQVFAQTRGHQPGVWAVIDKEDRVLALFLPVQITLLHKWLRPLSYLTMRAVSYGSVLYEENEQGKRALATLLKAYVKQADRGLLLTELRNLSSTESVQGTLREHGFTYEEHLNYLIDINKPPQAILQNIGQRTRKNIQRGLRQNLVKVVEANTLDQVAICYELLQKTYKAANIPLADCSLFDAAYQVLYPKGMIRYTLAYVDQTPVATSIDLLYKNVMYGWYGGLDRNFARYMPNELLTWRVLEWGAEHGYSIYDFGGAGKPNEKYGVRDFKAKFNGQLVNYGRNIYAHAPLRLKLSQKFYQMARSFLFTLTSRPESKDKALA